MMTQMILLKHQTKKEKNSLARGFMFMEVLVTVVILSTVISGILYAMVATKSRYGKTRNRIVAMNLLQQRVEELEWRYPPTKQIPEVSPTRYQISSKLPEFEALEVKENEAVWSQEPLILKRYKLKVTVSWPANLPEADRESIFTKTAIVRSE